MWKNIIRFQNIYEKNMNMKTFMNMKKYHQICYLIFFGFLVAPSNFLENIYEYEKISSDFKIFMNSKSAAHFHMSKYNREMKATT